MHGHAYSTYTNAIYKSVFGKDAKHLREDYGIAKKVYFESEFEVIGSVNKIKILHRKAGNRMAVSKR